MSLKQQRTNIVMSIFRIIMSFLNTILFIRKTITLLQLSQYVNDKTLIQIAFLYQAMNTFLGNSL